MRCYYIVDDQMVEIVEISKFDHFNKMVTGIDSEGNNITIAEDKLIIEED